MFIELSEALACPQCGTPQGLIVVVDRMSDRRVSSGRLDCPMCEARFPIRDGRIFFAGSASNALTSEEPTDIPAEPCPPIVSGLELAAVLGLEARGGYVVLGPGLAGTAVEAAELVPGVEILLLCGDEDEDEVDGGFRGAFGGGSHVCAALGTKATRRPLQGGKFVGAGLLAPEPADCEQALTALQVGSRLAVFLPSPCTADDLMGLGAEIVLAEERAVVVSKSGG